VEDSHYQLENLGFGGRGLGEGCTVELRPCIESLGEELGGFLRCNEGAEGSALEISVPGTL